MAKLTQETGGAPGPAAAAPGIREQGIAVVKALSEVTTKLQALRAKKESGKRIGKRELRQLEKLEDEYRRLEGELRSLMRPRTREALDF
jgi:hypothetical protein